MRRRTAACLLLPALLLAGCASGPDREQVRDEPAPKPTTQAPRVTRCGAGTPWHEPTEPTALLPARREVARAARRATSAGHRFHARLDVRAGRIPLPELIVDGRRTADGASIAQLRQRGTLMPDIDLRIVTDQLYLSFPAAEPPAWRHMGSASGIALDVGRELLDHPHLLEPVGAHRSGQPVSVEFRAPAARLRAYATRERRGPVSDLLARARRLEITTTSADGALVGDRFRLETVAPDGLPLVRAGAPLVIEGITTYCPLRTIDRSPIPAPRVSR